MLDISPNANVFHDYIGQREYWLSSWYLDRSIYAIPYLRKRKRTILKETQNNIIIDVNSYLNNDIESLNIVFQNPKIYHLVRDPRKVISSTFLRIHDSTVSKIPKEKESVKKWLDEEKFYRICFNWSQTVKYLLDSNIETVQLEKITSDFTYFSTKIIEPSKLEINYHEWEQIRKKKINRSKNSYFRKVMSSLKGDEFINEKIDFENLSKNRKKIFNDLCKPLMHLIGYY